MAITPDDPPAQDCEFCGELEADCQCDDFAPCPWCGEPIDYCQGHGEIADPLGHAFLGDAEEVA